MKKISGIFLALLTFFSSTLNVFADTVEVIEEKTQTINKEDYESLKEEVEKKVFELNEQDDEYVYDYEISITEEKDEVVIEETKKVTSEQKFTSEEEAKKFYEEYELEDSWKQGELTITSKQEDVVVNGDTITIKCQEATCASEIAALEEALNEFEELDVLSKNTTSEKDIKTIEYKVNDKVQELNYEDALKLVLTLNPEVEGYKLVKNEYVLVKKGSIEAKTFKDIMGKDTYETYAEAKAAADKFLNDKNYEDKVAVVVALYDESEKEITKKESIGFLNEELAWTAAIAQATAELEQAIANGEIELAKTLEETKAALEKAYETGKLGLTGMELDGKIVFYSLPELRVKETAETYTQTFYTKTAAELAKEALELINETSEETGISIEDIALTETAEEATNIKSLLSLRKLLGKYTFAPNLKDIGISGFEGYEIYYSITSDNKMVIWTAEALTAKEKEEITKSTKESNENITSITFITGYNTDNSIEGLGNVTFKKEEKSIFGRKYYDYTIAMDNEPADMVINAGIITTGKTYELSYKQVASTELWYYDRTEVKYGFDYTVQGGGATVTRDLFKVQSILSGNIYDYTMAYRVNNTQSYTSYIASFDIYKEATKTNATVEYKITREKAATGTVDPEEDNTNQDVVVTPEEETEQITPPNTGAESNLFISLGLLALLAGVVSLKKMCK